MYWTSKLVPWRHKKSLEKQRWQKTRYIKTWLQSLLPRSLLSGCTQQVRNSLDALTLLFWDLSFTILRKIMSFSLSFTIILLFVVRTWCPNKSHLRQRKKLSIVPTNSKSIMYYRIFFQVADKRLECWRGIISYLLLLWLLFWSMQICSIQCRLNVCNVYYTNYRIFLALLQCLLFL